LGILAVEVDITESRGIPKDWLGPWLLGQAHWCMPPKKLVFLLVYEFGACVCDLGLGVRRTGQDDSVSILSSANSIAQRFSCQ